MCTECMAQRSKNQNLTGKLVIQQLILPSDLKWQSARPDLFIVIVIVIVIWNISDFRREETCYQARQCVPSLRVASRSVETHI